MACNQSIRCTFKALILVGTCIHISLDKVLFSKYLQQYLNSEIAHCIEHLQQNASYTAWWHLAEVTLPDWFRFNKRRSNEQNSNKGLVGREQTRNWKKNSKQIERELMKKWVFQINFCFVAYVEFYLCKSFCKI